jgi:hypothetical protein
MNYPFPINFNFADLFMLASAGQLAELGFKCNCGLPTVGAVDFVFTSLLYAFCMMLGQGLVRLGYDWLSHGAQTS